MFNKPSVPDKINDENGITLTQLDDIANGFNRYYVNVGPNLAKKIDSDGAPKTPLLH